MKKKITVVGIGASAGGLEAVQSLFDNIPEDTGMAFVIVQHLSPNFKSMMDELLQKHTKMPVQLAKENIEIKPNNIYLNPKEKNIVFENGKIKYIDKTTQHPLNLPIDLFFHSLGNSLEENAIGIILSGTGTDGSRGIATIKGAGGTVIVQKPESAQFDGMPTTAINSGNAEFVALPEQMGIILDRITTNFFAKHEKSSIKEQEDGFEKILEILYKHSGVDFKLYKNSTLIRRIEKRVAIHLLQTYNEFANFISENKEEKELLVKDCLIGVTRYFRDLDAFEALEENVLSNLFNEKRRKDTPVRIWVSACSTGEEAYSIAIIIDNYLKKNNLTADYKIFATDIDKDSIQIASEGKYPVNYIADIPKKYLENYFVKSGDCFEIIKRIREKIVFSKHNLLKDPPFIKVDLISCRNLLIYLLPKVQYKVIGTFQFGLNKGGYLFLGHSESLGESQKMFKTIDAQWRIYKSIADYKELPSRLQTDLRLKNYESSGSNFEFQRNIPISQANTESLYTKALSTKLGPDCIFVNNNLEILYVNGNINDYVVFPSGIPNINLLEILADDKLKAMVRNGIRRTNTENKKVIFKDVPYFVNQKKKLVSLTFQKLETPPVNEPAILISFEKKKRAAKSDESIIYNQYKLDEFSKQRIEDLEAELKKTKQELQNTIEELETSNEELQASNEELQASNEELQSTNEELQSVNEELYTVNAEVQTKIKELTILNDDINNLLNSTKIATLFLDKNLNIRKFTPELKDIFQLRQDDIGRPINIFASNFMETIKNQIVEEACQVLNKRNTIEKEFRSNGNKYFLRKITPFIKDDDCVDGVVVSFVDISATKVYEQRYSALFNNHTGSIAINQIIYNKKGEAVDICILDGNKKLEQFFNISRNDLIGKSFTELYLEFDKKQKDLLNTYAEVDKSGISNRFELYYPERNKWYSHIVYRLEKEQIVTVSDDITEEKAKILQIEKEKHFNELLAESTPAAIYIYDVKSGTNSYINKQYTSILGYNLEEINSLPKDTFFDNFHPDDREEIGTSMNEVIEGRLVEGTKYRFKHKDGKWVWCYSVKSPFEYDDKGKVKTFIGSFIDITELKQAELKLKEQTANLIHSEKMNAIGTLIAGVAHELNNPLMSILNFTAYCKKHFPSENKAYPVLTDILKEAERSSDIVSNLLTFSRKDKGIHSDGSDTDIIGVLNDCLKVMHYKIKNNNIELKLSETNNIPQVNISHGYVQQLFFNIIDNALYALKDADKKVIEVRIKNNTKYVITEFIDTGCGISKENIQKIFNPFFTTKPPGEGTGLGLSISKNIILEAGGDIHLKSDVGKGTTISILFPIANKTRITKKERNEKEFISN